MFYLAITRTPEDLEPFRGVGRGRVGGVNFRSQGLEEGRRETPRGQGMEALLLSLSKKGRRDWADHRGGLREGFFLRLMET